MDPARNTAPTDTMNLPEEHRAIEAVVLSAVEPVPATLLAELLETSRRAGGSGVRGAGRGLPGRGPGFRARLRGRWLPLPDAPRHGAFRRAFRPGGRLVAALVRRPRVAGHHRLPPTGVAGPDRRAAGRERRRRGPALGAARLHRRRRARARARASPFCTGPPRRFWRSWGSASLEQLPPVEDLLPGPDAVEELEERLRPGADA